MPKVEREEEPLPTLKSASFALCSSLDKVGLTSELGCFAGRVAKFWRLRLVEPAGGICTSEPEGPHDPERDCREAEAPVEGRLQGPALRGGADPTSRLVVPPLPAQLSRHRRAVSGARLGGRPLDPEPVGAGLRAPDREETAGLPQATLRVDPRRRDVHQGPRPLAVFVPGHLISMARPWTFC